MTTRARPASRLAPLAALVLAGLAVFVVTACGSGSTTTTTTTTNASKPGHPGGTGGQGKGLGPGSGPGAPPATRTAHPRHNRRSQGPPGATLHSTYPGRIIGHGLAVSGPVQPAELWPVTNGWRISDHRILTAVYAGAVPGHRSTGRLVVFRQNFVRVTQTSDRVDVPGSGPLRVTSAPQGKVNQTAVQRHGTLHFAGANGTTGTLHLRNDSVTVGSS
ncbi:MAG: hypothetical protein ACJ75I_11250 [Solirubrobacterales bacterium]